jgi:hypothetical protein
MFPENSPKVLLGLVVCLFVVWYAVGMIEDDVVYELWFGGRAIGTGFGSQENAESMLEYSPEGTQVVQVTRTYEVVG